MSNIESIDNQIVQGEYLGLTSVAVNFMKQGAKWAAFLGVLGFIVTGIILLVGVFMIISGLSMRGYGAEYFFLIGVGYMIFGALNFFPAFFLYKYAIKAKRALNQTDNFQLEDAIRNLKLTFKFMGILAIIILGIYAVIFIVAIIANMRF